MPADDKLILANVARETRFLRRRAGLLALAAAALVGVVPLLLLGLLDLGWPLRESWAFAIFLGALLLAAGALAAWRCRRRSRLTDRAVALQVESAKPELMDSLICAVELLRRPTAELTALHRALLAQVESEMTGLDLRRLAAGARSWARLAIPLALLALALLAGVALLPLGGKAALFAADLCRGEASGIVVRPGDVEVATDADLLVEAEIRRGPRQAIITLKTADGELSYPMHAAGPDRHAFEIYGVGGDLTYFVSTPTMRSRTYQVATFAKPSVVAARLEIEPPAYTGRPRRTLEKLDDFAAPEGSKIVFWFRTNIAAEVTLAAGAEGQLRLEHVGANEHRYTLDLRRDLAFRLVLEDRRGHRLVGEREYRIKCIEDLAPVVQCLSPKDDAVYDKDASVPFSFEVADDYGISRIDLHFSINGRAWETLELAAYEGGEPVLKATVAQALALAGEVEYGDVISYYGAALDNAQPEPGQGACDLRFLEIRPPRQPPKDAPPGSSDKRESLNVSDLIMEQKRLIRQAWRYARMPAARQRPAMATALTKASGDLHVAARKRYHELKTKTVGFSLGVIDELFPAAIDNMANAEYVLEKGLVEESLPFQHSALAKLVAIEVELLKNARQQKSGKGKGKQKPPPPQVSQKDRQRERQQKLDQLRQAVGELDHLIARQEGVNRQLGRVPPSGPNDELKRRLAGKQGDIREETETLAKSLGSMPEAGGGERELGRASESMAAGRDKIQAGAAPGARQHGEMAANFLRRGRELLDQLRRDMAGDQMRQARRQLEDLQRRQRQLGQGTQQKREGKNAPSTSDLAGRQRQAREDLGNLMAQMQQLGNHIEEDSPAAARELREGLAKARSERLEGKMKRSENALRYERLDKARQYQGQVEQGLEGLAKKLQNAASQQTRMSPEQLAELLRRTIDNLEKLRQSSEAGDSKEAKRQLHQEIARELEEMARQLADPKLQEIAGRMTALAQGESGSSADLDRQAAALLVQTARLLETKLTDSTIRQKLELARLGGQLPPDEYRKLVNEYFKRLSTGAE